MGYRGRYRRRALWPYLLAGLLLGPLAILAASTLRAGGSASSSEPLVLLPPGVPGAGVGTPTPAPLPPPVLAPGDGIPYTWVLDIPILMYHDVLGVAPDDEFRAGANVLPADLAAQLDYLACAGFTTITVSQLIDLLNGDSEMPERPVLLTFDDGYDNHYGNVFWMLGRRGMAGSFSVPTGLVGQPGYVTWDQLREMSGAGMDLLAHSVSHLDLGAQDDEAAWDEISVSKAQIEEQTGHLVRGFVYPSGEPFRSGSAERKAAVLAMVEAAGYEAGLLAGEPSSQQDPAWPLELNRMRMTAEISLEEFAVMVGGPDPIDCGG